ncbi:hypothetical protein A2291_03480 [candidate division WOR-1 bacterium RIFOXYB2_FULL_42_35]|uniref:Uncharacterized protein n=1 Tax=candidate division WOR-1 bacterium RIFOXYC2_FULL_41_25 TaxID=1802586 RepID=A0A1F4TQP2_UNCSA|nr:MAG: hypothetical protein A2247_03050 [candidate division WOR-1 bacterium RIFOXYA2_FULL_41_14]OGC25525.1 MAG: hypothetical protein A2291_03480 [candidate division WOR-1 bacterium RIFOXYB2_FULL_42_35]OGC34957.1 MAG: hypothetical protein A2462_05110 [candidate division WOR-1 bacterium RIFOXYC2_FULL_41_25]OGC41530.1 MAG: hypothetical protein A2548_01475 [candidate division WOR-1 bacterium RIFOXYD2_FULL_41_8]
MQHKNKQKGYSYIIEDEKLLEFSKLSYGQRLEWFINMHNFLRRFQPEASRIAMNKLKDGEI